jgi:hypothetical protein
VKGSMLRSQFNEILANTYSAKLAFFFFKMLQINY